MKVKAIWLSLITAAALAGCGGSGKVPGRDPVFPISGKVMYKGKAVSGADVTFFCQEKDRSAFGRTDKDGSFQLTTFGMNDGAVAGKHTVTVSLMEVAEPTKPEAAIDSPDYYPPTMADLQRAPKPKAGLPKKYSDVKTSDLVVNVNEDGNNAEVVLELKD